MNNKKGRAGNWKGIETKKGKGKLQKEIRTAQPQVIKEHKRKN